MATAAESDLSSKVNAITWTEIPALDLARAKTFYSTVFGWNFPPSPTPSMASHFLMFNTAHHNGGLVKVSEENFLSPAVHPDNAKKERIAVRVTIQVESIDEKLVEIEKEGGALYLPKEEIPGDMGFVAYFTDSEKNVMGLWSAK